MDGHFARALVLLLILVLTIIGGVLALITFYDIIVMLPILGGIISVATERFAMLLQNLIKENERERE